MASATSERLFLDKPYPELAACSMLAATFMDPGVQLRMVT